MNTKIALSFLIGLAVGSTVTTLIITHLHNKQVEEEYIESTENQEFIGEEISERVVDTLEKANPAILSDEYHNIAIKYDIGDKKIPVDYNGIHKIMKNVIDINKDKLVSPKPVKDLKLITEKEYLAFDEMYEKVELYYDLEDELLTDEEDKEIIDTRLLDYCKVSPKFDKLFVRNEVLAIDYLIIGWSKV